jgi:hypothetical protein
MSSSPTRAKAAAVYRRSQATTENGPRYGVVLAAAFHILVFSAALLTFQRNFDTPEDSNVVPVDLVTIADVTNVAAQAPPAPEQQIEKIDIPVPANEPPPEPVMQAVEPAPEPPMPKFEIQKEVKKPVEKPAPPKKTAVQEMNDILNRLTAPEKPVKNAKPADRAIAGIGSGNAMTANIADALKSQIYRCWSPPIGAPDVRALIVDYALRLNRDGTVATLQLTPGSQVMAASNAYTRAAAEAASRAIYQCQPYRLPADRYNVWREINPLRFDPRQMMEQ